MAYSPLAVANEFIKLSKTNGGLSHIKVQKLCYYAQEMALGKNLETPLINEQPQVWQYGPVFKSLYQELKYHGPDQIKEPEAEGYFGEVQFINPKDKRSKDIIEKTWEKIEVILLFNCLI